MMIDTHAHLSRNDDNIDNVIEDMKNNIIICSGADKESNNETVYFANNYNNIYGTIGYHPDEANKSNDIDFIICNMDNKKIVGIGEIGLDYHNECNKELQKELFIKQLYLARLYKKPVVINIRDAAQDIYDILKNYKDLKKVIHCYSYSLEMANEFIKIGSYIGIGGVLTFKNAQKLKDVVANISLDRIILETDSPYLAPVPHRGEINVPHNIVYVAEVIAELKHISVEEVYKITTKNACEIYNINL